MKKIIALFSLLAVLGCSQSAPQVNTVPGSFVTPGGSTISHSWKWTNNGSPSPELASVSETLKTPEQISVFLQNNVTWQEDYDTTEFLSPNQVIARKKTVCTGFARFWNYTLSKNGYNSHFVAVWGQSSAHAFSVFKYEGYWRLGSNQYYYNKPENVLGVAGRDYLQTAAVNGAIEFYGQNWKVVEIYDDAGNIVERLTNSNSPSTAIPGSAERNLFNIRR